MQSAQISVPHYEKNVKVVSESRSEIARYSAHAAPQESACSLKSNFKVGNQLTPSPLVSPTQLQAHLNLLRAFKELRIRVEQDAHNLPPAAASLDTEKRWIWFLELAVERFERWSENISFSTQEGFITSEIPPLDVWMVWHSYMLNPIWYAEDCEREASLHQLKKLNEWDNVTLDAISSMGDVCSYEPTQIQNERWVGMTGLPFDPIESTHILVEQPLICPRCSGDVYAPYIAYEGRVEVGYAQQDFEYTCPLCYHHIKKSTLALSKFARDIARDPSNIDDVVSYGLGVYLPGTLHSATQKTDKVRARLIKNSVMKSSAFTNSQFSSLPRKFGAIRQDTDPLLWEEELKEKVNFSMDSVMSHLSKQLRPPLMKKILNAYHSDRPFSVDLVGAVLRQGLFIDKMHELGWTEPDFFCSKEDHVVLHHCVTRYHAFLDLMSSSTGGFFVPTLDIDLVWHTHQIFPGRYSDDCLQYFQRFIDHDDKVEENYLSTSFDVTCRAWQQRFGVPYTYCGCPLPGDTIGQKLSRLTKNMLGRKDSINPPNRDDYFLATHPSDHNAVSVSIVNHEQRQKRISKMQKRRVRDLKKVQEGKLDADLCRRGDMHGSAFLVPVPIYYPVGYAGFVGGCAAGVSRCTGGGINCGAGIGGCTAAGCSGGGGCGGGGGEFGGSGDGGGYGGY